LILFLFRIWMDNSGNFNLRAIYYLLGFIYFSVQQWGYKILKWFPRKGKTKKFTKSLKCSFLKNENKIIFCKKNYFKVFIQQKSNKNCIEKKFKKLFLLSFFNLGNFLLLSCPTFSIKQHYVWKIFDPKISRNFI